ncbi:hypothetical protein D3C78_589040 [compost metagenome]
MRFNQRNSRTLQACTSSTTDTVKVGIPATRHVKVNNMAYFRNVDTSRRYVGSHQNINATFSQTFNPFGTFHLRHIAFKITVIDTR